MSTTQEPAYKVYSDAQASVRREVERCYFCHIYELCEAHERRLVDAEDEDAGKTYAYRLGVESGKAHLASGGAPQWEESDADSAWAKVTETEFSKPIPFVFEEAFYDGFLAGAPLLRMANHRQRMAMDYWESRWGDGEIDADPSLVVSVAESPRFGPDDASGVTFTLVDGAKVFVPDYCDYEYEDGWRGGLCGDIVVTGGAS